MTGEPTSPAGGSLGRLREANRRAVLDALRRRRGGASRSELVQLTGLSRTTVTSLLGDLQAGGLISADRSPTERVTSARGRPPVVLRLAPAAGAALGVAFGHSHVDVAVSDLSGTILAERRTPLAVGAPAAAKLDSAVAAIDAVLDQAGVARGRLVGAGLGVPGPVRPAGARAAAPPRPTAPARFPSAEALSERYGGLEVRALNDASAEALAEWTLGAGRGIDDLIYVKVSEGIGGGLVLGGRLHHGVTGNAGEIGHVRAREDDAACRCGNRGCLETIAAVPVVLAALRRANGAQLDLAGALELVRDGDPATTRIVKDAGRAVGRVLADVCNAVNPAAIVVGGELAAPGSPLIDGIRESVDRYPKPEVAAAVEVRAGALGPRAEVLGALQLVLGEPAQMSVPPMSAAAAF